MNNFFRVLSLMICFELIVSPLMGVTNVGFIREAVADETCPAGFQFDTTLNRCLTSEQTAEVMNAVANCNGDKACYKQNAEQAITDAEADGAIKENLANKGGLMGAGMKPVAIAVPLLIAISTLASSPPCGSMSAYIMLGAGVAAFAGEKLANGGHKKRLKKLKEEWDKILATSTDSTKTSTTTSTTTTSTAAAPTAGDTKALATEAQSQAFEMLARSEDSLRSAAKMKSTIYAVSAAAFAGSAVLAGMELINPSKCAESTSPSAPVNPSAPVPVDPAISIPEGASSFMPSTGYYKPISIISPNVQSAKNFAGFITLFNSRSSYSSPTIEDYEQNIKLYGDIKVESDTLASLKSAAKTLYSNLIPIQNAEAAGAKGFGLLSTAPVRLAASTLLAVWSGVMSVHAGKQAKIAKNRAEFLRKMKLEFNEASAAINSCTTADRSSPSKVTCYCYTEAGQRNPDRVNSDVCQKLFNGKALTPAGTYLASTGTQTCVTKTGAVDSTCSCKTTNTCAKVSLNGLTGLDTGTFSLLNGATTDLNNLTNGNAEAAKLNGSASLSNAARLLDASNKNLQKTKAGQAVAKKKNQMMSDLSKGLTTSSAGMSNPYASASNGLGSMSPSQAVAELQDELKKAEPSINTASGGQVLAQPGNNGPAEDALDFSLDTEQTTANETQVAEVMKKNLDYGQNDIKSSNENLFNVLSNRYQRSGMRRLFDEEGKTKPDAPNKEDITK